MDSIESAFNILKYVGPPLILAGIAYGTNDQIRENVNKAMDLNNETPNSRKAVGEYINNKPNTYTFKK